MQLEEFGPLKLIGKIAGKAVELVHILIMRRVDPGMQLDPDLGRAARQSLQHFGGEGAVAMG
jgi:hypothetical protein